jgi:cysteinyl-tRNA synthetase
LSVSGTESATLGETTRVDTTPTEPPQDPAAQEAWALVWARVRAEAKRRRDYKEADRIRDLLTQAGWEVRDNKDGTVEVRRI